jgi:hypothetical protein
MNSIKDLLQAVSDNNLDLSIYTNPISKSVTVMIRKQTGDIITKVGHEFSKHDMQSWFDPDAVVGDIVNYSINEAVHNHIEVLKSI